MPRTPVYGAPTTFGSTSLTMNNRQAFVEKLSQMAERDPKIMLVVMDVGFSYIDSFEKKFPKQFLNLGVTEQSATGVCAGMALAGLRPYLYSMIPFVTMRNYEQVRNDICYHNAPVTLVGVQGSKAYKFLGLSHNMIGDEDTKILTGLPNLVQYYPQDAGEVKSLMGAAYAFKQPAYFRL